MRGFSGNAGSERAKRIVFACSITMAMLIATMASVGVINDTADARGPIYDGLQTPSEGPAYFGPAPNPIAYCDSPTYFDPFPQNVSPIGPMVVGDTASVTTGGVTMDLVITAKGNADSQYPGFFPFNGLGAGGDRAKGIELAEGDGAGITLSEPLFYSQWIFTDVDRRNEGFTVTPRWTEAGQAAAFGGDENFTFVGSTNLAVELDETETNGAEPSESINGRVQVDFLGAVTGIDMLRNSPSGGQSGFAVGGGCEAAGAAKAVIAGPTWNGTSFDVTYELRMRNNLPSSATIQEVITDAQAAVGQSYVSSTPQGIVLSNLQLTDDLSDPAFSQIQVTNATATGNLDLNENYDGLNDFELLDGGSIAAEDNEIITLTVQYTPDLDTANWDNCQAGYDYLNQSRVTGSAANVDVADLSDDGRNAAPNDNNGAGGVDDPTPVNFPCPPGGVQIVKTVVPGGTDCPTFDNGVVGLGDALPVTVGDVVTYCITVRNPGPGPIFNVGVTDPQAPGGNFTLSDLAAGGTQTVSYDVTATAQTPTVNVATVDANDAEGALDSATDDAQIVVSARPQPNLEIVKTVVAADADCPSFDAGVPDLGPALAVLDGESVTYCISVRNTGPGDALDVVIRDPQAPQDYALGTIVSGEGGDAEYTLVVDVDSTPSVNVATASYSGPDGARPQVSDDAQIEISPLLPRLEIVKTVLAGAGATCPAFDQGVDGIGPALPVDDRDTVTYCISVRNSGAGIATDVFVTDTQTPGDFELGTLAAGEERSITYDVVVGLNTPSVNTATVGGEGPEGSLDPDSDDAQILVDALPDPTLQIVKTALKGADAQCPNFDNGTSGLGDPVEFLEGEIITYCITVRNIGPGNATDVVIADDQAPDTFDLLIGDLGVDESVTRSYVLTAMMDTPTENTAFASGEGLNGPVGPVSDPAEIEISEQPNPVLEIVKTVVAGPDGICPNGFDAGTLGAGDPVAFEYGEVATYCITVRNSGGNAATSIAVADDQAPDVLRLGTIDPGESRSASYDVAIDEDTPLENVATATGDGPNGPVGPVSDPAVITASPEPDPELDIVKTVVDGPNGDCPTFDNGVEGQGDPLPVDLNGTVTYCISVRNVGAGTAQNVRIVDEQSPDAPYEIGLLQPGNGRDFQYEVVVIIGTPLVNVALVTGEGPNGPVPPDSDDTIIDLIDTRSPSIGLIHSVSLADDNCVTDAKSENSLVADLLGSEVTWCAKITNTGNVALANVLLNSPRLGLVDVDVLANGEDDVLAPQESVVIELPGTIPVERLRSIGVVTGDPVDESGTPLDLPSVTDTDDAIVLEAQIELETTVVAGADGDCEESTESITVRVGSAVTWCFTVTNTGNVSLEVTEVLALTIDEIVPIPEDMQVLRPGQTVVVSTTSEAPEGDFVNDAKVEGKPLNDDGIPFEQAPIVEDDDPANIVTPRADVALIKTNSDGGPVAVGATLEYALVVSNNGPHGADDVKVVDVLPAGLVYRTVPAADGWVCTLDTGDRGFTCLRSESMPSGATETLSYTAVTTTAAPGGTQLINTATATTSTPDTDPTNNTDTSVTSTPPDVVTPPVVNPPIEYPGPFTPPTPPAAPEPPDEVLGLAITGASSEILGLISVAMMAVGGVLSVGARRSRRED